MEIIYLIAKIVLCIGGLTILSVVGFVLFALFTQPKEINIQSLQEEHDYYKGKYFMESDEFNMYG